MTAMRNFIEGYLADPAQAISEARLGARQRFWYDEFDDDMIYKEIATPEFRLYQEVVMADESENFSRVSSLVSVA
jgi:hypothetical protein